MEVDDGAPDRDTAGGRAAHSCTGVPSRLVTRLESSGRPAGTGAGSTRVTSVPSSSSRSSTWSGSFQRDRTSRTVPSGA